MIGQLIAALIGTVAFALLFDTPKKYYPQCGLVGFTGWLVYLLVDRGTGSLLSLVVAAMVVAFLSKLCAIVLKCPATVFLISGLFPLVPGSMVYWTLYYIVSDQLDQAFVYGFGATKSAFAIVLGIVFIREIPRSFFDRLVPDKYKQ